MTAPSNLSNVVTLIEEGQSTQAIQEMSGCLEDQSTARKLSQYGQKITEIHRIETEQKESLGEIIQGYLSLKDEREASVVNDQTSDAYNAELAEAQIAKSKCDEKLSSFRQEVQAAQRDLDDLADLVKSLQCHQASVKEQTTEVLPKTRYNVSLYRSATKLTWDYNSQPEDIKGYISTSKDVKPFSLDSRQNSKFFIINYLWDLIESVSK
ncbi:kinetochore protein spc24-like [Asterias rubens]|uniref:kinetochore protein spc24-like n=1 Tax=Asterias rubens TaxID=7604 RepID=UPI0014552A3C|nr:kinetochore protein spc24-like [Asterias rubens]XP_033628790.1 kinetochore protein spc24-like [Asterias rubens]XP_033628791.1 kinetochore protein spc24-like [Asterias rubens]XP_033628792.1 kinetochore protein spc24-like [Asterias rubens]